jgi:3-oxoacyl-[acyl-carrier-protein] synthase III
MTARVLANRLSVLGTGCSLPGEAVSSAQLLARIEQNFAVDTSKGRVLTRKLHINERHISRAFKKRFESPISGARNPDLAAKALLQAVKDAHINMHDLQYLLGHTASPAQLMPPNIAAVANLVQFDGVTAELRQACTGFACALQMVAGMLTTTSASTSASPVAIVGSEVGSVYFDPASLHDTPEQWVNLMQMGDGAGAIVLAEGTKERASGYLDTLFYGKLAGVRAPGFSMNEGGSDFPALQAGRSSLTFSHDYNAVKSTGGALFKAGVDAVLSAGYHLNDFQWIIPHQVSGRIGVLLARELNLPPERFFVNANRVGNLGSAAIWVALHQLRHSGQLKLGERVLILGAEATHYMYGGFVYTHGELAL